MTALLEVSQLRMAYGSVIALDGVDLRVEPGARHAIVGENGAGKSTLLNLIAGLARPTSGRIMFRGRDVTRLSLIRRARLGLGRTHQRPAVWPSLTALENVVVAAWRARGGLRAAIGPRRYRRDLVEPAEFALDRVALAGRARVAAGELAHGERRQLELAMALAGEPTLLLLDEPAAGLPPSEQERLVTLLAALPRTVGVVLVEHHLEVVRALAETVTELRTGRAVTRLEVPDAASRVDQVEVPDAASRVDQVEVPDAAG